MKKIGIILGGGILLVIVLFGWWVFSRPERGMTGSVSTHFRWLGPNDKIVIDGFDDPKVHCVACHISRSHRVMAASFASVLQRADTGRLLRKRKSEVYL